MTNHVGRSGVFVLAILAREGASHAYALNQRVTDVVGTPPLPASSLYETTNLLEKHGLIGEVSREAAKRGKDRINFGITEKGLRRLTDELDAMKRLVDYSVDAGPDGRAGTRDVVLDADRIGTARIYDPATGIWNSSGGHDR